MTKEEALSAVVEAKLSRHQCNVIRSKDYERFPSYKKIQVVKVDCYPVSEDIFLTETCAEIKLQSLLNLTAKRLLIVQRDVLNAKFFDKEEIEHLSLITKWGFDGSSGHSSYKQKYVGTNADDYHIHGPPQISLWKL